MSELKNKADVSGWVESYLTNRFGVESSAITSDTKLVKIGAGRAERAYFEVAAEQKFQIKLQGEFEHAKTIGDVLKIIEATIPEVK